MNNICKLIAASVVLLPFAVGAQAADIAPDTQADQALWGAYVRGDIGWSFLDMSGAENDGDWVFGGGVGYKFNDNIRADVTADWTGDYKIGSGNELSTLAVLGNVYYDFTNSSMFTPYVGVGAGYGWTDGHGIADDDGFVVGAAAGVSVNLMENLDLDVGYRFRDFDVSGPNPIEHQVAAGLRFKF